MAEHQHNGTASVLLALLAGGVIGAGLALLFAPAAGIETRRRLRDGASDARHRAGDFIADSRERLGSFMDESRGRISELVEQGRETVESANSGLRGIIDEGRRAYRQRRNELDTNPPFPEVAPSDEGAVTT